MLKLSIIGTSNIVEEHIKVAKRCGFKLFSICSTRKNSKNLSYLKKKYNFNHSFNNWQEAIHHSHKYKDIIFLIAPRIKDTFKILYKALQKSNFIFVEKPVSIKINDFKKIRKYKNKIFVGYNRLFYKNINFVKKKISKIENVIVKCPESNRKNILSNSTHIISILIFLFGNLKIEKKIQTKNTLFVLLRNKINLPIYLYFNFGAPENFSIEINQKQKKYLFKPIEKLSIFSGIQVKPFSKNKNLNIFQPINTLTIDEFTINKLKPGFIDQMKNFKKFVTKKNSKSLSNIMFAQNVMSLALKITKK